MANNKHKNPIQKSVQSLFATIESLEKIYQAENEALSATDTKRFLSLQEEKIQTASLYESSIKEVMQRKDELKALDNGMKQKLQKMQQRFANTAQKNMDAIKRMQRTTSRLNDTMRLATKNAMNKRQTLGYGNSGRLDNPHKRMVSTGISETV